MKKGDQPAYPLPVAGTADGGMYTVAEKDFNSVGLTKREAFVMAAMQGLLANGEIMNHVNGFPPTYNIITYVDELLKQLES